MALIITHAPYSDEASLGYYRRLSASNSLMSWRDLASNAGVERQRHPLLMRHQEVAEGLGLQPEWTALASYQESLCRAWGRLHRVQVDAVCPTCVGESLYLRHHWEHAYVTACHKHQVQLVDKCNACGEALDPSRIYIGICSCGHDLANIPQTPATRAQCWLSALIAGQPSSTLMPVLRDVDSELLIKVVRTLCLNATPLAPSLPRGADLPKTVAQAIEFLAPLEHLLADWPLGFRSHVETRISTGKKDARTLNTLLGHWYISLRKTCQDTAFAPLLQIIIDVAAEKTECVLGLDSAKDMAQDTTQYLRAKDAAKTIGVSIARMHDAFYANECGHRTLRFGTRGLVFEVPRTEVERIVQQRLQWISDEQACQQHYITPAILDRMKAAGVVRSDAQWRADLLKAGPVQEQSLRDLHAQVTHNAKLTEVDADERITWKEFTSRRMGEKKTIESLLKAISNGEVHAINQANTLGEMAFLKADVQRYFGMPLLEAGMSVQQLAKATGWKWESISHWINEGLLASESIQLRGQPCRVVLPHQLIAFRQAYMPLADLAKAMGTKSSALQKLLHGVAFIGGKNVAPNAQRGLLIRIADLGRLALIGAKAEQDLFVSSE